MIISLLWETKKGEICSRVNTSIKYGGKEMELIFLARSYAIFSWFFDSRQLSLLLLWFFGEVISELTVWKKLWNYLLLWIKRPVHLILWLIEKRNKRIYFQVSRSPLLLKSGNNCRYESTHSKKNKCCYFHMKINTFWLHF